MADSSDVENALVGYLAPFIYPNGTAQPSITGAEVQIFRGWPGNQALDTGLSAQKSFVSVYGQSRGVRNTTRYPQDWRQIALTAPTLSATVSGLNVTFAGTGGVEQNVGVAQGNLGYVYPVQPSDTPTTVATALAVMIPGASSSGPTLSCPLVPTVTIGAVGSATQELRRQEQMFMVTCWCGVPAQRDTLAIALDAAVASISFLALSDGQQARIQYRDTASSDASENANLYRRDLTYLVEFATTRVMQNATLIFPIGTLPEQGTTFDFVIPSSEAPA